MRRLGQVTPEIPKACCQTRLGKAYNGMRRFTRESEKGGLIECIREAVKSICSVVEHWENGSTPFRAARIGSEEPNAKKALTRHKWRPICGLMCHLNNASELSASVRGKEQYTSFSV